MNLFLLGRLYGKFLVTSESFDFFENARGQFTTLLANSLCRGPSIQRAYMVRTDHLLQCR